MAKLLFLKREYLIELMSGIKAMVTLVRRGHGGNAKKVLQCLPRTHQTLLQDLSCLHGDEYCEILRGEICVRCKFPANGDAVCFADKTEVGQHYPRPCVVSVTLLWAHNLTGNVDFIR